MGERGELEESGKAGLAAGRDRQEAQRAKTLNGILHLWGGCWRAEIFRKS